ncbi:hypothetical protein LIER_13727 [Lithospermum erythrorhizon]|uniref:Uncharacterized protein n=1 Tax=Lithospermum erythrorhizon TaxID=34254 RepID=A0AAV3PXC8_LITER
MKPATEQVMTFVINTTTKGTPDYKSRFLPNATPNRGQGAARGTSGAARPRTAEARAVTCSTVMGSGRSSVGATWIQTADSILGVTSEQVQQLFSLLGSSSKQPSNDQLIGECLSRLWVLDSGASNHVMANLSLLSNLHDMPPCTVNLPDGGKVESLNVERSDNLFL